MIENPSFDSQTKEFMTTKVQNFGSKLELDEKFVKAILKTNMIDTIISTAKAREDAALAKNLKGGKKARLIGI